jgi:orotate phosphoribosyltransferase
LIEDVVTTGGAASNAAALVRTAGADVIAIACAIWRGECLPRIAGEPNLPIFEAMSLKRRRSPLVLFAPVGSN